MDEYIDVDRATVDRLGERGRVKQEKMKVTAMSRNMTDVIFKGDNVTNQREPNGLQNRLKTVDTNLFVNNAASGGGPLSLTKLSTAINAVNTCTHLCCSRDLIPFWDGAARDPALTNNTVVYDREDPMGRVDMNGKKIPTIKFNGIPILFGYEPEEGGVMLPFTEVASGGGSPVTSSIYAVSFMDERLFGIESTPLTVKDQGEKQGSPKLITHAKWDWGIVLEHSRSAARLSSITKAAFVA